MLHVSCVGAVGVASWLVGWSGEAAVGNGFAIGSNPVCSCLYVADLADRDIVEVYHIAADMGCGGLFAKQESAAGYAVFQRNGFDGQTLVFVDNNCFGCLNGVERNLVSKSFAEQFH